MSLIVRTRSGLISLRADRLGDVLDFDALGLEGGTPERATLIPDEGDGAGEGEGPILEPLPDTVRGPVRDVACGIIQLDGSLLLVLDPELLLPVGACLQLEGDGE